MTTQPQKQQANEPASPPVAKVRIGLITANIWERPSEKGRFHSVSFERRYRDKEGNWHSTHSYDAGDLLALAKAADLAHTRILELQRDTGDEGEAE